MTTKHIDATAYLAGSSVRGLGTVFAELATLLAAWAERTRSRRNLARLDDRLLADIGISHDTRQNEVEKPFWMS